MKTKIWLHLFGILWVSSLMTAFAAPANADGRQGEKSYNGTITAVDAKDKIVKVRGALFSRSFVLADDCNFAQWDNSKAALNNFRPGDRVEIRYQNASGVLVADRMAQEALRFSGIVQGMDANQHTLTVHSRGVNRTFMLADNCPILRNGKSGGAIGDVKWGDRVTVVYALPGDRMQAREIELPGMVFRGSLDAINLGDRSVSAGKRYLNDKQFHLADNCVILANGTLTGRMSDLQLGRDYELNYETVDGVNVVNRIARVESAAKTDDLQHHTALVVPPED